MPGFERGELLLKSIPYAYALKSSERGKRCDYCCELNDSLKRCSQCTFLYFCNKECQSKAWEYHRDECKCIRKVLPHEPPPSLRLIGQILLKIKRYGYNAPAEKVGDEMRSLADLESHASEIKKDVAMMEKVTILMEGLKDYLPNECIPEFSKVVEIYGKMTVNTFSIWDMNTTCIGAGFYLGASVFDHSCDPDAEVVFDGLTASIRAIRNLDHRDLRKVMITYIDPMQTTKDRQKQLEEQYFFTCQCIRCTDPTIEKLMTKSLADHDRVKDVVEHSRHNLERIRKRCREKGLGVVATEVYNIAMNDLSHQDGVLGDTNLCRVKMIEYVFESCILLDRWQEALAASYELIEPIRMYYSEYSLIYSYLLMKIGKIELLLEQNDKAEKHLIEAEQAIRVTHDKSHLLYKEVQKLLLQCQQEMALGVVP